MQLVRAGDPCASPDLWNDGGRAVELDGVADCTLERGIDDGLANEALAHTQRSTRMQHSHSSGASGAAGRAIQFTGLHHDGIFAHRHAFFTVDGLRKLGE